MALSPEAISNTTPLRAIVKKKIFSLLKINEENHEKWPKRASALLLFGIV